MTAECVIGSKEKHPGGESVNVGLELILANTAKLCPV